jgi:hypothetical protein
MDRKYLDRKFNDFNKFNQNDFRRGGYARDHQNEDSFRPRRPDRYARPNRDKFRDNFRGNIRGMRENLPRENIHETQTDCDDDDRDGYTEKFHERQVEYHKNVHTKQSGDDLREDRDDLRRGRDMTRGRGRGFQEDFRGDGL